MTEAQHDGLSYEGDPVLRLSDDGADITAQADVQEYQFGNDNQVIDLDGEKGIDVSREDGADLTLQVQDNAYDGNWGSGAEGGDLENVTVEIAADTADLTGVNNGEDLGGVAEVDGKSGKGFNVTASQVNAVSWENFTNDVSGGEIVMEDGDSDLTIGESNSDWDGATIQDAASGATTIADLGDDGTTTAMMTGEDSGLTETADFDMGGDFKFEFADDDPSPSGGEKFAANHEDVVIDGFTADDSGSVLDFSALDDNSDVDGGSYDQVGVVNDSESEDYLVFSEDASSNANFMAIGLESKDDAKLDLKDAYAYSGDTGLDLSSDLSELEGKEDISGDISGVSATDLAATDGSIELTGVDANDLANADFALS